MNNSTFRQCVAEFIGTWILVFFGTGVVHAGVMCGAPSGLWQVAVVWALAITLAIYAVGSISGAHLNPAVTIAMAVLNGFPWRRVPAFIVAQLAGAVCASCVLFALFSGSIAHFEKQRGIVRGQLGSELSAMCYGEYFPNPEVKKAREWSDEVVSMPAAMAGEFIGTAFLLFMIFGLTDPKQTRDFGSSFAPIFIGLTVAVAIMIIAPLTQAGFNPARDFGPRLVAWAAGWGSVAIPGPRGGFFLVYILAPIAGGVCGGAIYQFCVKERKSVE